MANNKKNEKNTKQILWIVLAVIAVAVVLFFVGRFYPGGIGGFISALTGQPAEQTDVAIVTDAGNDSGKTDAAKETPDQGGETSTKIDENGSYFDKDNVALYIHTYGKLPKNYITKSEARDLGWSGGSVQKYAPGKAIGGDTFSNAEKHLPTGVKYKECDIDTDGAKDRGAKRIVFGNDGSVWYTEDHYETFTRLY
ncbi:MAG: ribonuclease [Clostridia bacterium]|nr:ribonuclease [Clostridia bacterium]